MLAANPFTPENPVSLELFTILIVYLLVATILSVLAILVYRKCVSVGKKWLENRQATATSHRKIGRLFDIRFTRFAMNLYIPYIWVLTIIACFLGWVWLVIMGLNQLNMGAEASYVIVMIVIATIALPFSLLFSRLFLEIIIVFFRIESHLRAMRERDEEQRDSKRVIQETEV